MDLQICPIGPSRLRNLCCVTALLETKPQPQTLPYLHPFTRHLTTAESTRWRTRTFTPTFVRHVLEHQYNGGATAKAIRNKMTHLIIRPDPPNRGAPERLPLPSIRKLLDLPSMTRPKSHLGKPTSVLFLLVQLIETHLANGEMLSNSTSSILGSLAMMKLTLREMTSGHLG